MATFKIEWQERVTTKVGDKWNTTLSSAEGSVEGCTLWVKDWPTVALGQEVTGDLVTKVNGQFTNRTLYPAKTYKSFQAKPGAIKEAMATKAQNISAAQDNKAEVIKISSTMRMAVDCAIAEGEHAKYEGNTGFDFQEAIKRWRQWLWLEWSKEDKDYPPFA